jgi:hypothetical protein
MKTRYFTATSLDGFIATGYFRQVTSTNPVIPRSSPGSAYTQPTWVFVLDV